MTNELQTMDVLKQSLVTQNEQGKALIAVIERMEEQERRVDGKITQVESLVEKVSKEITINYEEQKRIQSIVSTKANTFAEEHLTNLGQGFSDNLFKAWKGLFIRKIYSKLKTKMNVVRYTAVKREEFELAVNFIEDLALNAFTLRDLQPSPAILNVMELEQKGAYLCKS